MNYKYYISGWSGNLWRESEANIWSCRFADGVWSKPEYMLDTETQWDLAPITDEEAMVELLQSTYYVSMKYFKEINGYNKSKRFGTDIKRGLTFRTETEEPDDWEIYSPRAGCWRKVGVGFMEDQKPHWRKEITREEAFMRVLQWLHIMKCYYFKRSGPELYFRYWKSGNGHNFWSQYTDIGWAAIVCPQYTLDELEDITEEEMFTELL